jgi:hypothetical protein
MSLLKDILLTFIKDKRHKGQNDQNGGGSKLIASQKMLLRMLRAVRLACELGFTIDLRQRRPYLDNADHLKHISKEELGMNLQDYYV